MIAVVIRKVTAIDEDGVHEALCATVDDPRLAEVEFVWHGGPYVDFGIDGSAADCWNVWDYETGKASIEYGPLSFASYVQNRLLDPDEVETVARLVAMDC